MINNTEMTSALIFMTHAGLKYKGTIQEQGWSNEDRGFRFITEDMDGNQVIVNSNVCRDRTAKQWNGYRFVYNHMMEPIPTVNSADIFITISPDGKYAVVANKEDFVKPKYQWLITEDGNYDEYIIDGMKKIHSRNAR